MAIVAGHLERHPCPLRTIWLAAYVCSVWERALISYEDALIMGGAPERREEAKAALAEIQAALTTPPVSLGIGFFSRTYGDLAVRRARLDALELARTLVGREPLTFRDVDPVSLLLATHRSRAGTSDAQPDGKE